MKVELRMKKKQLHWVNTPVLIEAIFRYEKGLLPNSMKLWIEQVLEIQSTKGPNHGKVNSLI